MVLRRAWPLEARSGGLLHLSLEARDLGLLLGDQLVGTATPLERFREVTLVQPTWFYHKDVWRRAGGFDGATCDDLRFFLRHCARGGLLRRVDESLVTYFRRADLPLMNRGAAAAATWIVRGVATTRRPRRG